MGSEQIICQTKFLKVCGCTDLQVTRMGMGAFLGGMMTRTPEWRQPRMAPPRASTMKLTRNLEEEE